MTTASSIQQMESILSDTYDAIAEMGGTIPENKNLENVAAAIDTIPTVPLASDLATLKMKLDAGTASLDFPPNSEVADTYKGQEIKWVIGHYGTATMADGTVKEGVYLFANQIVAKQSFGSTAYYDESPIDAWLNNSFFTSCSDTLKSLIGEITVPVYNSKSVNAKLWLMSVSEIMGASPSSVNGGGVAWDAWKIRTGFNSPSTSANSGRIMRDSNNSIQYWWTRSYNSASFVWYVDAIGYVNYRERLSNEFGIVPAWFMPKD